MVKKVSQIVTTKAFESKASKLSSRSNHTYSVPPSLYTTSSSDGKSSRKK
jgi:hypothetical protein